MARIFEFLIVALILYLAYRRMADPLRRGYDERERERREERRFGGWGKKPPPQIDRSNAKDAEFKDIT
jgi:hypothetical protein